MVSAYFDECFSDSQLQGKTLLSKQHVSTPPHPPTCNSPPDCSVFPGQERAGLSFCNSGCFYLNPWQCEGIAVLHRLKGMLFFNKSFLHTGYTLNIVKLSISSSQVTTFREQNPSLVSLSPGATRIRFHFKIPPAVLWPSCCFWARCPSLYFFLPDLIGKLEPEMWISEPHGNYACVAKVEQRKHLVFLEVNASWFLHGLTGLR